ncbi:recombinase family protein [Streptomyces sp. URMC 129]|uniref:recombinase family protein n=1 Tax=Streptomyces sp. URMC 129 TaxID=3423407 RepID=UPI003F1B05A7
MERLDVEYDRISDDKSGAGIGTDSQYDENSAFAAAFGVSFVRRYTDNDTSAYSGEVRRDYDRLLRDMEAGEIRSVTFWHANRLHRLTEELPRFIRVARRWKVTLYCTTRGGVYDLETASGRKALRDDTSSAEYESEHRGERVTIARKRQARNGDFGGGVRPYGWGVDTGRVRSVCINPKAPTAERIYEDRPVLDMGQHNPEEAAEIRYWAKEILAGVSEAQVIRDLKRRGVLTVSQKDGRQKKRNGKVVTHHGWSSQTFRQILTNPRTSGHSVYQGEIVKWNAYPPILEEDVRQALITIFSDPKRKSSPGNTPKWLGSLHYRCGICSDETTDIVMSVRHKHGRPVYCCRNRGHCQWDARKLDRYIENVIVERLSRPDLSDLIPRKTAVDLAALREELKTLQARKMQAGQSFARGAIDQAMLEATAAECDVRIHEIRTELKKGTEENPFTEFQVSDNARQTWESLSIGRKREICRRLLRVTLYPISRRGSFTTELIDVRQATPPAES